MKIDTTRKCIVGMLHLLPLKEERGFSIDEIIDRAQKDMHAIIDWGVDAICIINEGDYPWDICISEYEKVRYKQVAQRIRNETSLPLWVCVLYNDWKATCELAHEIDADFVRIDTFIDDVSSDAGVISAQPESIIAMKEVLCPDIQLFVDIHPKYKKVLSWRSLEESIQAALRYPIDGIIITGNKTGEAPLLEQLELIKQHFPNVCILAWSGITAENAQAFYMYINGAFIGTAFKNEEERVDTKKVSQIVRLIHKK